mgnify:CR=1 FL=1
MIRINKIGELSQSIFMMQNDFSNVVWQYSDYDWEDDYTQQEELLLEMCGCYGVSEEDVLLLLDYGYSADEIEEISWSKYSMTRFLSSADGIFKTYFPLFS